MENILPAAPAQAGEGGRRMRKFNWKRYGILYTRIALGAAFLSAVASRFGLWDKTPDLKHFGAFIQNTAQVVAFIPSAFIPLLAWAATTAETTLGILLILGIWPRLVSLAAAILLAMFGTAMAISFGLKSPLDYSVFSASGAAVLLSQHASSRLVHEGVNTGKEETNMNSKWIALAIITTLFMAGPSSISLLAQTPEESQLLQVREAVWRAWFSDDVKTLHALVPPDTIVISGGEEKWKHQAEVFQSAADFQSGGNKLIHLEFPRTEVQHFGDVAMVWSDYLVETELHGKRSVSTGRASEVFVRHDGQWINPGWHTDSTK
jgi:uncharacterized membrane protein YphA (DoxX/SURF4 family)/ketosteroid isomerase-like protein